MNKYIPVPPKAPPFFNRRISAVGLVGFCAFLGLYATQPLLPMLQEAFHTSKLGVSLTVSAATLSVALAAPWVGIIADIRGRKKVIVPAIWLLGITYLLTALTSTLSTLIFWRFLQGLLTPAVFAVTVAYINEEWPHEEAGYVTSVYVAGTVLGGFSGRFLSGFASACWSWQGSFILLGLLNLAMAAAVSFWLPAAKKFTGAGNIRTAVRNMLGHFHNRSLLTVYALGFTILFTLVGTFTYITFYLAEPPFCLGPTALGSLFTVYLIGAVITPLAGTLTHRFEGWKILSCALLTSILGILMTLFQLLPCVIIGITLCSSGVFICQIITNKTIGLVAGKSRASAVGLYVSFYYLGGFAGSFAPGFLWDSGGWPVSALFIASVTTLSFLMVLGYWRKLETIRRLRNEQSIGNIT